MSIFGADPQGRKDVPIYSGVVKYFPRALAAVARLSKKGNDQHNPGQPLFWNRAKSGDELDALMRHIIDGDWDAVAWRALAQCEKQEELKEKARFLVFITPEEADAYVAKLNEDWGEPQCES